MTKRLALKTRYKERLESCMNDVKINLNQIHRLEARISSDIISKQVIEKDLARSFCDLEISMALMAVIFRKLKENQYISLTREEQNDINALIHSNRFDYEEDKVVVYSRLSKESVTLEHFLELGDKIINEIS